MKRNWADVAAPNREKAAGAELTYVVPMVDDGKKVVHFEEDDVIEELNRWNKALIVYVLDAKPSFHVIKQFVERKWGKFGEIKIYLLKTGVFVMEFQDLNARAEVMESGPWSFASNKPVIIKPWRPDVNKSRKRGLGCSSNLDSIS